MLAEDDLRDAILLVFANKQDLPNAMNCQEVTDKLGLRSLGARTWCAPCFSQHCMSVVGKSGCWRLQKAVWGPVTVAEHAGLAGLHYTDGLDYTDWGLS